ncbi:serine hydrolase [Zafaria cholistanensis]|uniref:Serine hydrolase n=1 Tax=Zafaria cholistanensis TaxID=1682741 RepID=A0A5A7NUB7_9MICC|nr:serine hydrolase domain-containing protein [Zafaria cholistanensis]GER24246.1 serine hydrolase [Zafaria cholistanensis]
MTAQNDSPAPAGPAQDGPAQDGSCAGEPAAQDPRFAPVAALLENFAAGDPDYSAQLCVYVAGRPVLDLAVGPHCTPDSLTGVFSCSKGAAAMVMGLLVQDGLLDLEAPVAGYWPEFAANGKQDITVSQLLSHQAGVLGIDGGLPTSHYLDSELGAGQLAMSEPLWIPGRAHAYHALTIGVLMEELARRITGERLQEIYERRIRVPFGLDFHLGLAAAHEPRYRDVLHPLEAPPLPFTDPFGHLGIAVNSAAGFDGPGGRTHNIIDVPNAREVREAGIAAAGGTASARGMARLYAAASTGVVLPDGTAAGPFLSEATRAALSREQVFGIDRASGLTGAFGIVFMKSQPRNDFGSWRAYGHDGANGALAYADPLYGIGFGYVPARAEATGTGSRGGLLSVAVRQALLAG